MTDTTIKKVKASHSPRGEMGQKYLVSGKTVSMRLWEAEPDASKAPTRRHYETVGYVIAALPSSTSRGRWCGSKPGDSWLVPKGAEHGYEILEPFTAVEATSPPAQVHGRDQG